MNRPIRAWQPPSTTSACAAHKAGFVPPKDVPVLDAASIAKTVNSYFPDWKYTEQDCCVVCRAEKLKQQFSEVDARLAAPPQPRRPRWRDGYSDSLKDG